MCKRIGYMPEERGLYPTMRVAEQLRYFARLHGYDAAAARASATSWLERLGVADRAADKVESLSLGNQQRVQLAAALVHSPELLVLDEPFSGLDPAGVDDLAGVLAERARAGATVLFSSHQLDLVEHLCDSVAIINRGRCVAAGAVRDLERGGNPRLAVEVAGDPTGAWVRGIAGVTVSENLGGRLRLILGPDADPGHVAAAATAAGRLEHFAYETRRLSEVFREAVGQPLDEAAA
jgi:ABC-2 type transport system ATP-binding protein